MKLTVVVTVYNTETYIERCLNSILNQNSDLFRVIIVDDGSTDRSYEICRKMGLDKDKHVKLIQLAHGGVAKARNYGLSQVETPYVLFLDSDDWLDSDTISGISSMLEEFQPDLGVFGFYFEMANGYQKLLCNNRTKILSSREEILSVFVNLWNSGLMYSSCNKIFSVELLRKHRIVFRDMDFGEDMEFCKDVMRVCSSMYFVDRCFYHYECHVRGSLSTSFREDLFEIRRSEHSRFRAYFQELNLLDGRAEEYLSRRYIERLVGCVENECSPENRKTLRQRMRKVREMVKDCYTVPCAKCAHLTSIRMKLLVLPLRFGWYRIALLCGYVMSFCRNRFPAFFSWLKMNR